MLRLPGLHQEAKHLAAVDGADCLFDLGETRHHQADRAWMFCFHPFEELHTAYPRHFLVGKNDVDFTILEDLLRGICAVGGENVELRREQYLQGIEDGW